MYYNHCNYVLSAMFVLLFISSSHAQLPPSAKTILANSPLINWVGRTAVDTTGAVFFDWEGVSSTITVAAPYTFITADIVDNCVGTHVGGGSRWAVDITTSDSGVTPVAHRVATFYTSPFIQRYALFSNQGGMCDPDCNFSGNTTIRLTRLTESRLSGCSLAGGNLSITGFASDGVFISSPPPRKIALEFIGDSISAGDLNDGAGADGSLPQFCGNIPMNDDITKTSGARLCLAPPMGFDADCYFTAWGGITLGEMSGGSNPLYESTFSALGPAAGYGVWNFSEALVDAVVINLGTNDRPSPPAIDWQNKYVAFVQRIQVLYARAPPAIFLAYGPMTNEYEPFVKNISATLVAGGVRAFTLDLTLPHAMTGCFGHPSSADNLEIAAKARPQIAAAMKWA